MWTYARTIVGVALVAFTACGGGDLGLEPTPASLAGNWHATKAVVYSDEHNVRSEKISKGWSITLAITDVNYTYAHTISSPGSGTTVTRGIWSLSGRVLTMHDNAGGPTYLYDIESLTGTSFVMRGADGYVYVGETEYPANTETTFERD